MGRGRRPALRRAGCALAFLLCLVAAPAASEWETLEAGLDLGLFAMPAQSEAGDSRLTVLRVDPRRWRLGLATARENNETVLTARDWARREGFVAAINAGMYYADRSTHTALMVHHGRVLNPRFRSWGALLGLDPRAAGLPSARLIDRRCRGESRETLQTRYTTVIQNMRLFNCSGTPVWRQSAERKWSIAALAQDGMGRIQFLYSASPYSVHDFARHIRRLPLGIERAMYLEGGGPSQLFIRAGGRTVERYGTHGSRGAVILPGPRPIPNVIGVLRRD